MSYTFERLTKKYRKPVIDIFNYYIENSFAAHPEAAMEYGCFDIFMEMAKGYPSLVAKAETGDVVGFAFLHPYHPASTFNRTAEITYFILPEHTGKGLGKIILDRFIEEARKLGVDNLLVNISSHNRKSLTFHRNYGFNECGRFRKVGRKFGKSFDVVWMQKRI